VEGAFTLSAVRFRFERMVLNGTLTVRSIDYAVAAVYLKDADSVGNGEVVFAGSGSYTWAGTIYIRTMEQQSGYADDRPGSRSTGASGEYTGLLRQ